MAMGRNCGRWADFSPEALDDLWPQTLATTLPQQANSRLESSRAQAARPMPRPAPQAPSPDVMWAAFETWGRASERQQDIPDYALHFLALYLWLVLRGGCPASFLSELQGLLCKILPQTTDLPAWVKRVVYIYRFT